MALIVEDGSGVANAESLCSVADASTYHAARGNDAWAALASDTIREQFLRKATDYMQQRYRSSWKGWRTTYKQALDWPRQGVIITDYPLTAFQLLNVVPNEVKNACAELALRASVADLAPDLERQQNKVTVGPLTVEYDPDGPAFIQFRAVDMLLRPFLSLGTGAMHRVERA